MKKPIVMFEAHPVIAECVKKSNIFIEDCERQFDFLRKKGEQLKESVNKNKDEYWHTVEDYFKTNNLYPADFNEKKHHLHVEEELGMIYMCDEDHHQVPDFIQKLMR